MSKQRSAAPPPQASLAPPAGGDIAPLESRIASLSCWRAPVDIAPLPGGLSNCNFIVHCGGERFVVRTSRSASPHPVDRQAEIAATRAAARAGLCPELVHAGAGTLVLRHVEGRTLEAADLGRPDMLRRVASVLATCRTLVPGFYEGPRPDRTPAAILSHYRRLLASRPNRWRMQALSHAGRIRRAVALLARQPAGFAHNDVHAGNFIDDGRRLWLIDWEYAGFGLPIADLASLAVNGGLNPVAGRELMALVDEGWLNRRLRLDFTAARLAAALRDLFWGYAQDAFGGGFPDAEAYVAINEERVRAEAAAVQPGVVAR